MRMFYCCVAGNFFKQDDKKIQMMLGPCKRTIIRLVAMKNGLKYSINSKQFKSRLKEVVLGCFPATQYLKPGIFNYYNLQNCQMHSDRKDEQRKKKSGSGSEDRDQQSSDNDGSGSDESERLSFVVDDDVEDSYDDDDYSQSEKQKKKKKKKQKKQKKKKKKSKRRDSDDSVLADDLEVVDEAQESLKRLKKNRDKSYKENEDDYEAEEEEYYSNNQVQREDYDSGYGRHQYQDESEHSEYQNRRYEQADLNDLLDQRVRKQFFAETTDKQIVEMDLPERQIIKYKNYAKILEKKIDEVQKIFQAEERATQAKWIYKRLRQMDNFEVHDEKQCRLKIENVLLAMHKDHLDIMYIFYYRKKIWADALNLNLLMKIQQIDEEWMTFKKQFKSLEDDLTSVIPSFQQVPRSLTESLNQCTDIRQLKYFKQYTSFILAKRKSDVQIKSNNKKLITIRQICDKGIDTWLADRQPFLSPHNFCLNIRSRMQEKKPSTPHTPPDKTFRKLLKEREKQAEQANGQERLYSRKVQVAITDDKQQQVDDRKKDWSSYPLLAPDKRITTLINYLAIELFNYPEMRKILKEKYYKKLLISTSPTAQGSHHIGIYNSFFPIKRIKDKPVMFLKKQMWILAREAEKLGLITIELKFEWQLSSSDKKNFEGDPVYGELVKYYFDLNSQSSGETWNLLRKQVLVRMLTDHFLPAFVEEVKEDLTREGTKEIIESCCQKFRSQLNKGVSLKEGQPIKILAMVLEQQKLGIAFVDEQGKQHSPLSIQLKTDDLLKRFVTDQVLQKLIQQYHPDMILVSANCRRAQTLRKQLRNPNLFSQSVYCEFGEYEVPNLMANKNIIQGVSSEKCILQAISMARLKKNPMAEILGLWSDNIEENGVYSMNLHPMQKYINKRKLIDALEKVAIEIVNLVGVNIDDIRNSDHCRNVLQFVSGLGPRKAFDLIEKVKEKYPPTRRHLLEIVKGNFIYINCSPFIKFERQQHLEMIDRLTGGGQREEGKKEKKHKSKDGIDRSEINLLDMTRIPEEWYALTQKLFLQTIKANNMSELKHKKSSQHITDEQTSVREMFKHPEKLRNVQWDSRKDENKYYDENLVKTQIMNNFKDPREPQKVKENKQIFYSLLKETPQTLRKFMVVTVRVLSVNQQYLNVVIPENGLFGYIKLPNDKTGDRSGDRTGNNNNKPKYEKGQFLKAVITGFPSFDDRRQRDRQEGDQEQELLKVDMSFNFPHKSEEKGHDCQRQCLPSILKEIHPNIDLDKQNFDLSKQHLPQVQVKEDVVLRPKAEFKRISHPKFKNINMQTAVQEVKQLKVGDFLIRPSTEGNNFLTITWQFYKNVISHIKLKCEQRPQNPALFTYRVLDRSKDKVYPSIDEIIEKYLKPMNNLVQDVISNKKFLPNSLQQIEDKVRGQAAKQQSYIQYFFGCSPQYPQFFILVYMYREKRPVKELIRVKPDGLYFHDQIFHSLRELISFFKEHLKDRKYQNYVKNTAIKK